MSVEYLVSTSSTQRIGDHLGSTSLVTDASGIVISQTLYKAWGETRYSSGTNPSEYTYTGQYSYASDFGLHFYNARWYDSSLSRFAQADTIVPASQGVQAWDRYAYVNNSPVNFVDPTGHNACGPDNIYCGGLAENDYYHRSAPNGNNGGGGRGSGGGLVSPLPPGPVCTMMLACTSQNAFTAPPPYSSSVDNTLSSLQVIVTAVGVSQLRTVTQGSNLIVYGTRATRTLVGLNPYTNRIGLSNTSRLATGNPASSVSTAANALSLAY